MRIVVEKYPYKYSDLVKALPGYTRIPQPNNKGYVQIDDIGYCFLPEANDCAFFLPKVILKRTELSNKNNTNPVSVNESDDENGEDVTSHDWVFGKYDPAELLKPDNEMLKDNDDRIFLHELSVWIYRAIREYMRLNDSNILLYNNFSLLDNSYNDVDYTFMDIFLSLIKFNDENQDFFMFVIKNVHSGYNKINWRKTIACRQPVMQNNTPIYMNPINRKKQINFDEELLIIFFSILNYLKEQYGFLVKINFNYDLIKGERFNKYLNGYGEIRLKRIKYKYFSDKALKLWNLCYAFFKRKNYVFSSSKVSNDYLLTYKFENVFEAIIDELIGQQDLPKDLRKQKDGKRIDHLYKYQDLVHKSEEKQSEIFYIGDSKYYKIGSSVGDYSIYKQYTYAKNVIQFDFDWGFKHEPYDWLYLDPLTEGYNITPNFFISANIGEPPYGFDFDEKEDGLKPHLDGESNQVVHLNKHFKNRLFDRDTLWISHYDINFLFILVLYGRGNSTEKSRFKKKAREGFRTAIINFLNDKYDFYILRPKIENEFEKAIEANFKKLIGKIYRPDENQKLVILALEKDDKVKDDFWAGISDFFDIQEEYYLK